MPLETPLSRPFKRLLFPLKSESLLINAENMHMEGDNHYREAETTLKMSFDNFIGIRDI